MTDDEKAEAQRYARVRVALEACATLEELARSWFYVSPDEWTLAQQDELRRLVCARLAVLGAPAPKTLVEVFAEANIAYNVAKAFRAEKQSDGSDKVIDGGRVGFFSLEMSAEQLATRILSEQAEVASEKIRRGMITEDEFRKLSGVAKEMSVAPLYIDQTGGISIAQLAARARKLKRQKGLDLLIVDYLQLLSGSSKRGDNRVQEITEITTGLKALAKELVVPIIALSQLSRQVEQREDKRPQLSDLRESGSIEQDADVVMFVFREEYYVERQKPREGTPEFNDWQTQMMAVSGKAEVIIGKQRHGPVGAVQLAFESQFTRFGNLAREFQMPERYE